MASIPGLLDGHITLEVECLDRLYLKGYIGRLATPGGLVTFMRDQLGKPIPSPVVLGQVTERFREAVKALAEGTAADSGLSVCAQGEEGRHRQPVSARARHARRRHLHRGSTGKGESLQWEEGQRAVPV